MKRSWTQAPFHPLLFAAHPVLYLFWRNSGSVYASQVLRPLAVSVAGALLMLGLLRLVFRDVTRAALALSAFILLFFQFDLMRRGLGHVPGVPPTYGALGLFAALMAIAVPAAWKLPDRGLRLPQLLNFVGAALVALTLLNIGKTALARPRVPPPTATAPALKAPAGPLPDIYYIIVDGYGREDVLRDIYGADISGFTGYLRKRGFYVATEARSNYGQTLLSVTSSLNMKYLDDVVRPGSRDRKPLLRMLRDNEVSRLLASLGYTRVVYPAGYLTSERIPADLRPSDGRDPSFSEQALLHTTLLGALEGAAHHASRLVRWMPPARHRARVLFALDNLGRLPADRHPQFVVAHIWCPHPPFVFSREGRAKRQETWYTGDGIGPRKTRNRYRTEYAEQVEFINAKLPPMIDRILAVSRTPPIILLQADHGPGSRLHHRDPAQTDIRERMSILSAYYLPGGPGRLYPGITPVNSFRLIFDRYFGGNLPLLRDESYLSPWDAPYQFVRYEPTAGRPSPRRH